jgi:hypothetical protein
MTDFEFYTLEDEMTCVLDYLNYEDYSRLYVTSSQWKNLIERKTSYLDFLDILKKSKISYKDSKKLFYFCCSQDRLDIAKHLYLTCNFKISVLIDGFYNKIFEINIKTVTGALKIKGINISKYSFFQREESFNIVMSFVEEIDIILKTFGDTITNEMYYEDIFCKVLDRLIISNKIFIDFIELIYIVGDMSDTELQNKFELCCLHNKLEIAKYFYSMKMNNKAILKGLMSAFSKNNMEIIDWILSLNKLDISQVFLELCLCKNMTMIQYLIKKFNITKNSVYTFYYKSQYDLDEFLDNLVSNNILV